VTGLADRSRGGRVEGRDSVRRRVWMVTSGDRVLLSVDDPAAVTEFIETTGRAFPVRVTSVAA